jgi:hypothetical protein
VRTRRPTLSLLAAALVALGAAGCGATTTVGAGGTLQVALNEYRVSPQSVRAHTGLVSIFVHNYGRLTHNLVISLNGQLIVTTKPLMPGQTAELEAALIPGQYLMASSILSDQALVAYGTLDVH